MNWGCIIIEKRLLKVDYMKYLPEDLSQAFDHDLKQCPDFNEIIKPLINVSDVLKAHYILADYFTDPTADAEIEKMLVGVRSFDLLASAICRQTCSYAGRMKYTDPLEICATLFFGLVKDHAFHDGNKRTALLTLLNQLHSYGYYPKSGIYDFEKLVVAVADNKIESKYNKAWKKFKTSDDQTISQDLRLSRRLD